MRTDRLADSLARLTRTDGEALKRRSPASVCALGSPQCVPIEQNAARAGPGAYIDLYRNQFGGVPISAAMAQTDGGAATPRAPNDSRAQTGLGAGAARRSADRGDRTHLRRELLGLRGARKVWPRLNREGILVAVERLVRTAGLGGAPRQSGTHPRVRPVRPLYHRRNTPTSAHPAVLPAVVKSGGNACLCHNQSAGHRGPCLQIPSNDGGSERSRRTRIRSIRHTISCNAIIGASLPVHSLGSRVMLATTEC